MKKCILVLGSFGYEQKQLDGQTIKTRQVYQLLQDNYVGQVNYFCSMLLRKKPYLYALLLLKIFCSKTIIMLYPAAGGFQTMLPAVYKIGKTFNKRIIYIAIGSNQIDCIEGTGMFTCQRNDLLHVCKNLDAFLSETKQVQNILRKKYHFTNVDLFPNFRYFNPQQLPFSPASTKTLRLVFMARITPEKGCDVAFRFFEAIKEQSLNITLDFYGPIDEMYKVEFCKQIEKYQYYGVSYKGILQPQDIHTTLRNYDIMLLPTQREGIPGSIIDAYIASLPVIVTKWPFASEIVKDNYNGYIVAYDDPERQKEFSDTILRLYYDRELLNQMKRNALATRNQYSAESAWDALKKHL